MTKDHVCGFVAIVGRPNVGKSSLLNRLVGKKISIATRKPQTTRHRILGIRNDPDAQIIFVDTPGMHSDGRRQLNRLINRTARGSIEGVDIVIMMIDARGLQPEDSLVLRQLEGFDRPVFCVLNKIDLMSSPKAILPRIDEIRGLYDFTEVFPLSVKREHNLDALVSSLKSHLPSGSPGFPPDQLTDRSDAFLCSEMVREQLYLKLGDELPYATAVEVMRMVRDEQGHLSIEATIWVEKSSQKKIVIGQAGARMKAIGQAARHEMEAALGERVHLDLWVKVKENWGDDRAKLRALGYTEE